MRKINILYILRGGDLYRDNRSMLQTILSIRDYVNPFVCMVNDGLVGEELRKNAIPYKIIANTMAPRSYDIGSLNHLLHFPFYVLKSIITYFQLLKVASHFKPDIVSSNLSFIYAGVYLSKTIKVPHVWHLREYVDKDHNKQLPRKRFFETNIKKSHCIAVSKGVFEYRNLSYDKDAYIYNGVFSTSDIPCYDSLKEDYFLYLGRITEAKGVTEMIRGFMKFCNQNKNINLVIAGEGTPKYLAKIKAILCEGNALQRVQFLPFHKDIRPLLTKAKALIVPSFFEAYGRITPEALLCGCFVIGRNTGGTKEILENVNAGILFNNEEELTQSMMRVAQMSNDELCNINKSAMDKAAKYYTCEENASYMVKFYQKVLNSQKL